MIRSLRPTMLAAATLACAGSPDAPPLSAPPPAEPPAEAAAAVVLAVDTPYVLGSPPVRITLLALWTDTYEDSSHLGHARIRVEGAGEPREVEGDLPLVIEVGDQQVRVEGMHRAVASIRPLPPR